MSDNLGSRVCSACGAHNNLISRSLLCISETKYWSGKGGNYTNRDNEVTWNVTLCDSCMPMARKVYIQNQISRGLKTMGMGAIALTVSIVMFLIVDGDQLLSHLEQPSDLIESIINGPKTFFEFALLGLMFLFFCAGVIQIPQGFIVASTNLIRKKTCASKTNISSRWVNKCIIGESERVLKSLGSGNTDNSPIHGEFILPPFKNPSELKGEARKQAKEQDDMIQWKKRSIVHKSIR